MRVHVKENPQLVDEYLVAWTPSIVVADNQGRVHYRVEGFLLPEDFLAYLSLGMGKFWLHGKELDHARDRFDEVARRHAQTDAGAEALYWLGVAQYKQSHDPAQLRPSWQKLAKEHPDSDWAKRTRLPG
jgi:hypothetical protein